MASTMMTLKMITMMVMMMMMMRMMMMMMTPTMVMTPVEAQRGLPPLCARHVRRAE